MQWQKAERWRGSHVDKRPTDHGGKNTLPADNIGKTVFDIGQDCFDTRGYFFRFLLGRLRDLNDQQ